MYFQRYLIISRHEKILLMIRISSRKLAEDDVNAPLRHDDDGNFVWARHGYRMQPADQDIVKPILVWVMERSSREKSSRIGVIFPSCICNARSVIIQDRRTLLRWYRSSKSYSASQPKSNSSSAKNDRLTPFESIHPFIAASARYLVFTVVLVAACRPYQT